MKKYRRLAILKHCKNYFKKTLTSNLNIQFIKKNYKLIILTSFISSVVTAFLIYYTSSRIRLNECLNNNAALYSFIDGNLKLIEEELNTKVYNKNGYTVRILNNKLHIVSDNTMGYTKIYKNNILQSIQVYYPLSDFISYLNPKFWITGSRTVRSERMHHIRSENEIENLDSLINSYGEDFLTSTNLSYIPYEDSYIILK